MGENHRRSDLVEKNMRAQDVIPPGSQGPGEVFSFTWLILNNLCPPDSASSSAADFIKRQRLENAVAMLTIWAYAQCGTRPKGTIIGRVCATKGLACRWLNDVIQGKVRKLEFGSTIVMHNFQAPSYSSLREQHALFCMSVHRDPGSGKP